MKSLFPKKQLRELLFTMLLLAISWKGNAQFRSPYEMPDTVSFALTPVKKNTVVKGLTFGLTANPYAFREGVYTQVNGVNLEVGPMGLVGGLFGFGYWLFGFFYPYADETLSLPNAHYETAVNGISMSLFGLTDAYTSGLAINGLYGEAYSMRGVQISGLISIADSLRGVSVAGLHNDATVAHGLQIGLTNRCNRGNVVQIGLFNRIGRRVIPFINLSFGKKRKKGS